ncbi:hypothetical protein GGX14DRAFT_569389 [Mycena pura]|uniref:Uncharacterized protein n=1 Tax=Mycena pura TaxID=153505 RepID=A0AAD6VBE1_9AGAR|nr:hypothetical protein GGX14DRAFT_569389 [Mycena pura]
MAPAPTSDSESDAGYSTGDSEDEKKIHQLSLAAIEDTFRNFEAKIKKYRKTHLSPRALTAMTLEKGAQRMSGKLPENNQGKGARHKTHFDDPDVKPRLQAFARGLVPENEGGFKGRIAPDKLQHYVNEHLFPELKIDDTIGVMTATAWLKKLGYHLRRYQKGIYYDGHERPDVVQKRNEFIKDVFACLNNTYQYKDEKLDEAGTSHRKTGPSNSQEILPTLKAGDTIYYPIFHDGSTIHANDQSHFVWETDDQHELRQKSHGRLIHISDFIISSLTYTFAK